MSNVMLQRENERWLIRIFDEHEYVKVGSREQCKWCDLELPRPYLSKLEDLMDDFWWRNR